jgi:hypothetical protein
MGNAPEEVPDEVVAQAKAAFARRTKDEIAVLAWDSLVDEDAPASDHRLRFEHPEAQIELRVLAADSWSTIEGRVRPAVQAAIELESDDRNVVRAGEVLDGAFALTHVAPGVVRLCLRGSGSSVSVCTDWFRI